VTFIDHPHTDPAYQRDLSALSGREGVNGISNVGLKNVRWSEKHNQLVVDVHSNVKDPFGSLEPAKRGQSAATQTTTRHIGQRCKLRGTKK
jgi:hypothetical protein